MDANAFYPPTTVQIAQGVYDDFFAKASNQIFKINPIDQGDVVTFMCALYTSLSTRRDVPPEMLAKHIEHEKACEALLARNIAELLISPQDIGNAEQSPDLYIETANALARDIAKAMERHIQTLPSHQSPRRTP